MIINKIEPNPSEKVNSKDAKKVRIADHFTSTLCIEAARSATNLISWRENLLSTNSFSLMSNESMVAMNLNKGEIIQERECDQQAQATQVIVQNFKDELVKSPPSGSTHWMRPTSPQSAISFWGSHRTVTANSNLDVCGDLRAPVFPEKERRVAQREPSESYSRKHQRHSRDSWQRAWKTLQSLWKASDDVVLRLVRCPR
jgi:hypothetical protein